MFFRTCISALILGALWGAPAWSRPADPRPVMRVQPDGTVITTSQRGDEHFHGFVSSDGYPLLRDSLEVWRYVGADGLISAQQAHNPASRDSAESAFVGGLSPRLIWSRMQTRENFSASSAGSFASVTSLKPATIAAAADSFVRPTRKEGMGTVTGDIRGLVVLVQFTDSVFGLSDPQTEYTSYMNKAGYSDYGMAGSVRDYFIATSDSLFRPTFDVVGPYTLKHPAGYYGGNSNGQSGSDTGLVSLLSEVAQKISTLDLSGYDNDDDGTVDFVYIIYAGKGEADGGAANSIWPQAGQILGSIKGKNKAFDHFAVSNERSGSASSYALDGIASFCHEFCHVLGLPDIYQVGATETLITPGYWDLMDIGVYDCADATYGNGGCTPPYLNALERYTLGWLTPTVLSGDSVTYVPALASNQAYVVPSSHDSEYFLLENRQQSSWDAGLPGHGLLVWHINYDSADWVNNTVNASALHVDVQEADGIPARGDGGDAYPGLSGVTTAVLSSWGGTVLDTLQNIAERHDSVCFTGDAAVTCLTSAASGVGAGGRSPAMILSRDVLLVPAASGTRVLELRTASGRLLLRRRLSTGATKIDLSSWHGRGVLLARLRAENSLQNQVLVVP